MNDFIANLTETMPDMIIGILILIIAILLGNVAKKITIKALKLKKVDLHLDNNQKGATNVSELIGKLAFVLTILFFLPGIFERFGVSSISIPLLSMMGNILDYIPRIIGAGLLIFIGIIIAKFVQQVIIIFLKKIHTDRLKTKMGIEESTSTSWFSSPDVSLAELGGKIFYVVLLIPFIIAALEVLQISAITDPAVTMLTNITAMIPKIVVSGLVILAGIFISSFIGDFIAQIMTGFGFSEKLAKALDEPIDKGFNLGNMISMIVRIIIILFFTVQGFEILGLALFTSMGSVIIAYIPIVLSALLIVFGGYVLGSIAKKFLIRTLPQARFQGILIKNAVIVLFSLIALSQLGIAAFFIEVIFIAVIASASVAFAISFGVGSKEFARNVMGKVEKSMEDNKNTLKELQKKVVEEDELKEAQQNRE